MTLPPPSSTPPPPPSTPRRDLLLAIRAFAAGQYEVLGELGLDERGDLLFLARAIDDGALVGLRVEAPGRALRDGRTVALAVERELDALVGAAARCERCAAPVAADALCRSCQANPLSGQLVRERPAGPIELAALLGRHGLAGWQAVEPVRESPDGTPFYYVHDAEGERALLLFLRAEAPVGDAPVLYRPCLAPAFAGSTPLDALPATVSQPAAAHTASEAVPVAPSLPGKACAQCGAVYAGDVMFCPRDGTALRAAANASLVGSVVAERYHVLDTLGEGGMGKVYLAEHVKIRRRCALKVMSSALAQDVDAVGRFVREAENAARVSHPNVAAVYDFGETPDGIAYMAMELVEGEPLSKTMQREHTLPAGRAAELMRQVALGLAAAHELGIVHRDLKPDNVMVTRGRDGREVVKVVDFGIAKAESRGGQQITRTGIVIGTPEYMSPEQLMGEAVDARSDLYALGCILHRLLTGRPPFGSATEGQMLAIGARLTAPPPRPSEVTPGVPPAFDDVVARLMAPNPAQRYSSAAEVAEALRPLTALTAGAAAPAAGAGAFVDPRTGGSAPALLSGPTGPTTGGAPPVTAERPAAARPAAWQWALAAVVALAVAAGGWTLLQRDDPGQLPPTPALADATGALPAADGDAGAAPAPAETETFSRTDAAPAPVVEPPAPVAGGAAEPAPRPRPAAPAGRPAAQPSSPTPTPGADVTPAPPASEPVVARPEPIPTAPPVVAPVSRPEPAPSGAPSPEERRAAAQHEARAAINALVGRFEQYVDDRGIAGLRALYPAMSRDQQEYWRMLLSDTRNVKELDARLALVRWSGDGEPYEVEFAGTLNYRDGRNAAQSVPYRARATVAAGAGGELVFLKLDETFGK